MKTTAFLLVLVLTVLCGCTHTYVLTMDSGLRMTTTTKPRLKGSRYVFKDGRGKEISVPAGRVREIAPSSMSKEERPAFNAQPQSR